MNQDNRKQFQEMWVEAKAEIRTWSPKKSFLREFFMFRPKIYKRLRWFTSDELEMARSVSPMMLDCFETFGVCDINESFKIRSPEPSTSNSKFIKIGSFSGCGKSGDIGFLSDDQKPGQIYIENKKSAELELISESLELLFIIVASEEIR